MGRDGQAGNGDGVQGAQTYNFAPASQFRTRLKEIDRALYICHYLLGTSKYTLVYDGKGGGGLIGFADSDWASDPITRKSTMGYLVKLANGVWRRCFDGPSLSLSCCQSDTKPVGHLRWQRRWKTKGEPTS